MELFELFGESLGPVLATLLTWMLAIYAVLLVYMLASYIMQSLSLFTIAKRRGIANYGLAWVPMAYLWTLGSIADQYDATHGMQRKWRHTLLWLAGAVTVVFVVGYVTTIVSLISRIAVVSQYQQQMPGEAVLKLVMSMYLWLIPVALVSGAQTICQWTCYFKLYESCKPNKAVLLLLLSAMLPFAFPFCLLACRKKDLGMPLSTQESVGIPAATVMDAEATPAENQPEQPPFTI